MSFPNVFIGDPETLCASGEPRVSSEQKRRWMPAKKTAGMTVFTVVIPECFCRESSDFMR